MDEENKHAVKQWEADLVIAVLSITLSQKMLQTTHNIFRQDHIILVKAQQTIWNTTKYFC